MFKHSHKKQKDSLETRVVLKEISVMLKFSEGPKTPGITFKKMAFSEGNQRYSSIYKEMELEIDCLTSKILLQ